MAENGPGNGDGLRLELTSSARTQVPRGLQAYANFLLPKVARPALADMARRGPTVQDLPLLTRFAAAYPDPDVHRMILAALARALPKKKLAPAFLHLYQLEGPNRTSRRGLIREVLAAFDSAVLAPIWAHSERAEKLDIVARLRRMRDQSLERFMSQLTLSDDRDPVISCLSIDIWERLDDEAATRVLVKRLKKRNPKLRAQSLEALAVILDPEEALRLLARFHNDPDPEPRAAALAGLARLDRREGRWGLTRMLGSPSIDDRVAAQRELQRLARPSDSISRPVEQASVKTRRTQRMQRVPRPGGVRTETQAAIPAIPAPATLAATESGEVPLPPRAYASQG